MVAEYMTLQDEASELAKHIFGHNTQKRDSFIQKVLEACRTAQGKDIIVMHHPGGWGTTSLPQCLPWERSIISGISQTLEGMGYSYALVQCFRSGQGIREYINDVREQLSFFTHKAKVGAAETRFILNHLKDTKIIMVGVSQGAGFCNAVMLELKGCQRVYSIEFGAPFYYRSRRWITEHTKAVNGNGVLPDALMNRDLSTITLTYLGAPWRWLRYRLQGKHEKFSRCVDVPGHNYSWEYPEVRKQVGDFLKENFGKKDNVEVKLPEIGENY